ncbi:Colicin V production protein [Anatilimnocola aggregata]|uniref:Colicin V production protein n=1 Tax=Anatilimnocola aggregata TaxID=2528021 RepID=A0A517YHK6_9BACT|nr:hypothetical protein [Anatilimnocola aggregata]QDU29692.1 Colicin V production protein [Anatilimnocola aggregata]
MLMTMLLVFILVLTAGTLWFHGLWSNGITLINLLLAMLLATNFYEPVATFAYDMSPAATYFWDFVSVWVLFFIFFGAFRGITDSLSKQQVKFILPVEMAGRTILALWCGWLLVCFTTFTLQMAPLNNPEPMGAWKGPTDRVFLGFAPDRMWLGFMQQESRGYLSRSNFSGVENPKDTQAQLNIEAFDPTSEFPFKFRYRRVKYSELEGMTP